MKTKQDTLCINTLRDTFLTSIKNTDVPPFIVSMNAARITYVLWTRIMKHSPANSWWYSRDRFVIGAGVNAITHFAILHLTGYDISWQDILNYRQLKSVTPGHPEAGVTPGAELTVGSFGAAMASAVGLAMAEKHQAGRFNRPGFDVIDNYTYAILYDGDLQEGLSNEAASLAGYLKLGKLICLFNNNSEAVGRRDFLQDGDDIRARFGAYGWTVLDADGEDPDDIERAVNAAKEDTLHPTLIIVSGKDAGQMEEGTYNENYRPSDEAYRLFRRNSEKGDQLERSWRSMVLDYKIRYPKEYELFDSTLTGDYGDTAPFLEEFLNRTEAEATTMSCRAIAEKLNENMPSVFGGVCELMPMPGYIKEKDFSHKNPTGSFIQYGNRESCMASVMNGISAYGGIFTYGIDFMVLSDYMRPAVRIAAMMKADLAYVLINDSVWNGQDGPTHQPLEQLPAYRAVPGLTVIRPADTAETAESWKYMLEGGRGPVALIVSKNPLPALTKDRPNPRYDVRRGAYVLYESEGGFDTILIATGSEVSLCREACGILEERGIGVRLVNMPSWELFEEQSDDYKLSVLPPSCKARVAVEAAYPLGWEKYTGDGGAVMGLTEFGLSAPAQVLKEYYGFTPKNVADTAEKVLNEIRTER